MHRTLASSAVAAVAALASAQSPLTTTFIGGNGGANGGVVYFDLQLSVGISIGALDCNFVSAAGSVGAVDLLTCPTTHTGNETNAAAWTLRGSAPVASQNPTFTPTHAVLATPVTLLPGSYGIALRNSALLGHAFTNGTGSNQVYGNADLVLTAGAAQNVPFVGAPSLPRVWNGRIYYGVLPGYATGGYQYGSGCYRKVRSFYEFFSAGTLFDLANSSLSLLNSGGSYVVLPGLTTFVPPSANAVNLGLTDDSQTTITLAGTFSFPGGSTSTLNVCSNGFISPVANGTSFAPGVAAFLAGATRWASWHDYVPNATHNVMFEQVNNVAYVTWNAVPEIGFPGSACTFQFQFDRTTGNVHLVYQGMSQLAGSHLVGYTPGGGALDPGTVDISASLPGTITLSAVDSQALAVASQRPVIGTTANITTSNIKPGTILGANILSFVQHDPGISAAPFGMPGCFQYVGLDATHAFLTGGSSTNGFGLAIPSSPAFAGANVFTQSFAFSPGVNVLGVESSNGLALHLGLN